MEIGIEWLIMEFGSTRKIKHSAQQLLKSIGADS